MTFNQFFCLIPFSTISYTSCASKNNQTIIILLKSYFIIWYGKRQTSSNNVMVLQKFRGWNLMLCKNVFAYSIIGVFFEIAKQNKLLHSRLLDIPRVKLPPTCLSLSISFMPCDVRSKEFVVWTSMQYTESIL